MGRGQSRNASLIFEMHVLMFSGSRLVTQNWPNDQAQRQVGREKARQTRCAFDLHQPMKTERPHLFAAALLFCLVWLRLRFRSNAVPEPSKPIVVGSGICEMVPTTIPPPRAVAPELATRPDDELVSVTHP